MRAVGRLRGQADLAALLAIVACALLLHRDGLFGGPAFYERDTQLFYYPLAAWVGDQLRSGIYPLWMPSIFTGYPIYADGELGLLYLPQLAMLMSLPTPLAMVWLRVLHVALAGAFMFAFLRTIRLATIPALGGGLVFAFGSFLTAQIHHENVVRSSVWLPLVLVCAERGLRSCALAQRLAWIGLGALAFGSAALGLHVQPVLMSGLALAAWVGFRVLAGPFVTSDGPRWATNRLATFVIVISGIGLGGLAIAGAQWLPLAEWALVSSRRAGVAYEFASAFGLAPENLPTLIFPYFFRLPDSSTWWSLWQQWETILYVGIPTLSLAALGIVFSRRREMVFFALLGGLALLVGMAHYAPVFNLHHVLWSVPGFSFLRAPGRFTYLVVFAFSGLAALGLQALSERRPRLLLGIVGAVPPIALLAAMLAMLPAWRTRFTADPAAALDTIRATYLATRSQYDMSPQVVYDGLLSSLDLANPKTAWSLALLGLTGLLFVVWLALGPRRTQLGQSLFVAAIAVDLLVFASDFHPRAPLASLTPAAPPAVTLNARVFLRDPTSLPELEANQLAETGLTAADGYSSLPSQRHVELYDATQQQLGLLDLWSARFLIESTAPADLRSANRVTFRADHPLFSGSGGSHPATFRVPAGVSPRTLRVIGTLGYAFEVPQGTPVAEISVDGGAPVPLRAGVELAERAFDRPALNGLVQHQKPAVALSLPGTAADGEEYQAHLYQADVPMPGGASGALTITPLLPRVQVQIYGLGLVDGANQVRSLALADREGLRLVGESGRLRVLEDTSTLPRAFVVDRARAVSPAMYPNMTSVQVVSSPGFDPRAAVLIEGDGSLSGAVLAGSADAAVDPRAADIVDVGPNALRVAAAADAPSYLVLNDFYHRGWTAFVDGQPAPVFIANALFRAVALEPGSHIVEWRYQPVTHLLGAIVSAIALIGLAVVLVRARRSMLRREDLSLIER